MSDIYSATKENDGSFKPNSEKSLAVEPVICSNCGHVMLFKAN